MKKYEEQMRSAEMRPRKKKLEPVKLEGGRYTVKTGV